MQQVIESIQQMKQELNEIISKPNCKLDDGQALELSQRLDELINTYIEMDSK